MQDIMDLHTHTFVSGHAFNTMNEMIQAAAEKGLKVLGITDHGPAYPESCKNVYFRSLWMPSRKKMGITVLYGIELNILDFDGTVDMLKKDLAKMDLTVASMHPACFKSGNKKENTRAYLNTMKNPYINIVGHPDDGNYPVDYKALAEGAREYGVLLEINNSSLKNKGHRKDSEENYRKMLEYCREFETPVILDSDAHVDTDVGNHDCAIKLLEDVDFPEHLVVNTNLELLKKYLNYYK